MKIEVLQKEMVAAMKARDKERKETIFRKNWWKEPFSKN